MSGIMSLFDRKPRPAPAARLVPQRSAFMQHQPADFRAVLDQPVDFHTATVSQLKGGVGKSTVLLLAGLGMSDLLKYSKSVLFDANPDRGTISERVGLRNTYTIRNIIEEAGTIHGKADFERFLNRDDATGLEVIAAEKDPRYSRQTLDSDFETIRAIVAKYRNYMLVDTGTQLTSELMWTIMSKTDRLVVPAPLAADGFALALETLDWWRVHTPDGRGDKLVRDAIVVLVDDAGFVVDYDAIGGLPDAELGAEVRAQHKKWSEDGNELESDYRAQLKEAGVRNVVGVPHDPMLKLGYLVRWEELLPSTRDAATELVYYLAQGFKDTPLYKQQPERPVNAIEKVRRHEKAQVTAGRAAKKAITSEKATTPTPAAAPERKAPAAVKPATKPAARKTLTGRGVLSGSKRTPTPTPAPVLTPAPVAALDQGTPAEEVVDAELVANDGAVEEAPQMAEASAGSTGAHAVDPEDYQEDPPEADDIEEDAGDEEPTDDLDTVDDLTPEAEEDNYPQDADIDIDMPVIPDPPDGDNMVYVGVDENGEDMWGQLDEFGRVQFFNLPGGPVWLHWDAQAQHWQEYNGSEWVEFQG